MAEEAAAKKRLEAEGPAPVESKKDHHVVEEKVAAPPTPEKRAQESKALAAVDKESEPAPKKISSGSLDRDVALAELEKEKRDSFIKAWEESEKYKAEDKAQKKLSAVTAWENSKKAALEAKLRSPEEKIEKTKTEYAEKTKNKIALIHKEAEEKRAIVEARRGEEILKAEEMAAKFCATGHTPKKYIGCF